MMEALKLRVPAITAEKAANEAVNAMLRNEQQVSIPSYQICLTMIFRLFSFKTQQLIRDYVLKENETLELKKHKIVDG